MKLTRCIAAVAIVVILLGAAQAANADAFGAIAYSPSTGSYGYWYGAGSRAAAENGALNRCSGADRQIVVWVENGWAALAVNDNGGWGWGWSTSSRAQAENKALNAAGGADSGAHILCWVASGN